MLFKTCPQSYQQKHVQSSDLEYGNLSSRITINPSTDKLFLVKKYLVDIFFFFFIFFFFLGGEEFFPRKFEVRFTKATHRLYSTRLSI